MTEATYTLIKLMWKYIKAKEKAKLYLPASPESSAQMDKANDCGRTIDALLADWEKKNKKGESDVNVFDLSDVARKRREQGSL